MWTGKEVCEALKTHVNLVVNDTAMWSNQQPIFSTPIQGWRRSSRTLASTSTIPYAHNGEPHDYLPELLARLAGKPERHLVVEIKGADWDGRTEIKAQAAQRWCAAINATAKFGTWEYLLARRVGDVKGG